MKTPGTFRLHRVVSGVLGRCPTFTFTLCLYFLLGLFFIEIFFAYIYIYGSVLCGMEFCKKSSMESAEDHDYIVMVAMFRFFQGRHYVRPILRSGGGWENGTVSGFVDHASSLLLGIFKTPLV